MASPADGTTVNVVCAADAGYAMPLATMLRSLLSRLRQGSHLALHVVDAGIRADDWARLEELCRGGGVELRRHEPVESDLAGLPTWGRMSSTTYHRLMLPRLLPHLDRAIWLDCDLLVEADVTDLWELDLEDGALLAAEDQLVPLVSSRYGVLLVARARTARGCAVLQLRCDGRRSRPVARGGNRGARRSATCASTETRSSSGTRRA